MAQTVGTLIWLSVFVGWLGRRARAVPAKTTSLYSDTTCTTIITHTKAFKEFFPLAEDSGGAVEFDECGEGVGYSYISTCDIITGETSTSYYASDTCSGDATTTLDVQGCQTTDDSTTLPTTCGALEGNSCSVICVDDEPIPRPSSFEEFHLIGDQYSDGECIDPTGVESTQIPILSSANATTSDCSASTGTYYFQTACQSDGTYISWTYATDDTTCSDPINEVVLDFSNSVLCVNGYDGYWYDVSACAIGPNIIAGQATPSPIGGITTTPAVATTPSPTSKGGVTTAPGAAMTSSPTSAGGGTFAPTILDTMEPSLSETGQGGDDDLPAGGDDDTATGTDTNGAVRAFEGNVVGVAVALASVAIVTIFSSEGWCSDTHY